MSKTMPQRLASLTNRLDIVERKLFDISKEIATTKETSNLFWSRMRVQSRKAYEEARIIFTEWEKLNIPQVYNRNIQLQIRRIKEMSFEPNKTVNYLVFKNSDLSRRTTGIIIADSVSDVSLGLNSGNKKLNRLMGLTQQLNITEASLEKAIAEGFQERASIAGVRKSIQNELLKDALDKKYITVVNKNGKPINYNIKSYSDMVASTSMIQSQSDGTVNLALAYGSDLVQVSSHNTETPYDAQFEGKVYSLSGRDKDFPPASDLPPFHPNCRHVITVYFKDAHSDSQIEKISDFSKGKTGVHPTRKSHIPVSER